MPGVAPQPWDRPRRSAFAAAFLSLLYPGLGHAYLGRWLRALAWAILPTLAILAGAAILLRSAGETDSEGLSRYLEALTPLLDPAMSTAVYGTILIDLLYRLAAVVDAYRLARDPLVGSSGSRMLSTVGLLGIVLILVASHVAVARPVGFAYDTITEITSNSGDDSALPNAQDLEQLGIAFPELSPEPLASGGPAATQRPSEPEPTPTPSEGPGWDGKQRLNILLVGHDGGRQGIADESFNTDTLIVVSVDPRTGRVAFISLPRDMSGIPLPRSWRAYRAFGGKYTNKINTLYPAARGRPDLFPGSDRERGYQALMGALGQLYGLRIDYYVAVDLNSFRGVINDVLKGVIVDVQVPVYDPKYPSADGRGNLKLYMPPGMQFMNGQRALAYSRSRHGSSDFDRAARQQRLFSSVRDQLDLSSLFAPGVIDKLVRQVTKHVKTNIPPKMIPKLVSLAQEVDLDRRENLVLSSAAYGRICYPCPPNGLWMLIANPSNIRRAVQDVFSGSLRSEKDRQRVEDEGAIVHVLNGAGGSNSKATSIADALAERGLNAVVPPIAGGKADDDDYRDTVITVYNGAGAELTETIKRLKRSFGKAKVVEADDPEQLANIVVIVGSRTKPLKARR